MINCEILGGHTLGSLVKLLLFLKENSLTCQDGVLIVDILTINTDVVISLFSDVLVDCHWILKNDDDFIDELTNKFCLFLSSNKVSFN